MLAIERKKRILESLNESPFMTIKGLAHQFEVSQMTIRRDLVELKKEHPILLTHGGVTREVPVAQEVPYIEKTERHFDLKKRLAEKAMDFVKDQQVVLLGNGTTTLELAKLLTQKKQLTVITGDLNISHYLAKFSHIQLYQIGGYIDSISQAVVGEEAIDFLDQINIDVCFLGCLSWNFDKGVTSPSVRKSQLKRKMMEVCKSNILIADHSKFGKYSFSKIAPIQEFDVLISDKKLPTFAKEKLSELNVNSYFI